MPPAPAKTAKPAGVPIGARAAAVLSLAYRARRAALLEGPTGIGKSELVRQVADALKIGFRVVDLSLLEPPDLVGLPVVADGRTRYATPSALPTDGAGILLLEELNRADRTVQQPALQLLTARQLHEYELPAGWVPFAAINPEDGEYQVTPLDPALRSRFLNLKVRADIKAWRAWAAANHVHPAVRRLATQHDDLLDTVPPRTWTYVSDVLHTLTRADREDDELVADAIGGYLPAAWSKRVRDELDNEAEPPDGFDVAELFTKYHKDAGLRARFQALAANGQTDALFRAQRRILDVVDGPELLRLIGADAFSLDAFEAVLADLPGDHRAAVQKAIAEHAAVAKLLQPTPDIVASAQYPNSGHMATVAGWARDAKKSHRVAILARAVVAWLEAHADISILRQKKAAVAGLVAFAGQVRSAELDEALARHQLG